MTELKNLLKAKRVHREEEEKKQNVTTEQQRCFMGKERGKMREEMQIEKMARDAKLRKKEKKRCIT